MDCIEGWFQRDHRRAEVRILDVFENAASVRVDAGAWVDTSTSRATGPGVG